MSDFNLQSGMELRVLHAAAYQHTWYGKWGYNFGRGPFNISKKTWKSTVSSVHNTPMTSLLADFESCIADRRMLNIIEQYQVHLRTGNSPSCIEFDH